jgi:hypothetical protein
MQSGALKCRGSSGDDDDHLAEPQPRLTVTPLNPAESRVRWLRGEVDA